MPSLNLITTTAGRAAILGAIAAPSTIVVADAQLSSVNQSVGVGTTSLSTVVATLTAVGSVRTAGAGHALHLVIVDDSAAAYSVRALAVRLDDGTFLMVYSQSAVIATKSSGSSLHLAFDLTIDADTAATIEFGDTDYALPAATESAAGVLELATSTELDTGTDITRAITPAEFTRRTSFLLAGLSCMNRVQRTPAGGSVSGGLWSICYDSTLGLFVAVGSLGAIQTSPDGKTWTARTAGSSYAGSFYGVATNGAGLLVAVGHLGEIQTSTNGTTWTHRTAAGSYSGDFACVTYGGGLWVAVGQSGAIQTSTNGTTWTARTPAGGFTGVFRSVTYGGGMYAAVGDTGTIQTSTNGSTWVSRTSSTSRALYGVAYSPYGFCAVGSYNTIAISSDGIAWTSVEGASTSQNTMCITYASGCFVACAGTDGVIWVLDSRGVAKKVATRSDITTDSYAVCFGKNSFVFVGENGAIEQAFL